MSGHYKHVQQEDKCLAITNMFNNEDKCLAITNMFNNEDKCLAITNMFNNEDKCLAITNMFNNEDKCLTITNMFNNEDKCLAITNLDSATCHATSNSVRKVQCRIEIVAMVSDEIVHSKKWLLYQVFQLNRLQILQPVISFRD